MSLIYATTNLLNSTTLPVDNATYRSTEDTTYQVENLYNARPSKPFRFTAKANQWLKANLVDRKIATISCVFNHNFTDAATVLFYASGHNGGWKLIGTYSYREWDEYVKFGIYEKWLRLTVSDAGNDNYPQIGEWFVGEHAEFANAYVTPEREDGPIYYVADEVTPAGQDWEIYFGNAERLTMRLSSLSNSNETDALHTFLDAVMENGGRFVLIPKDTFPQCYYVKVMNRDDFATRRIFGDVTTLRDWRLDLKVLVRGLTLS